MPKCRLVRWRSRRQSPAGIGRLRPKTFVSDSWLPLLLTALASQHGLICSRHARTLLDTRSCCVVAVTGRNYSRGRALSCHPPSLMGGSMGGAPYPDPLQNLDVTLDYGPPGYGLRVTGGPLTRFALRS